MYYRHLFSALDGDIDGLIRRIIESGVAVCFFLYRHVQISVLYDMTKSFVNRSQKRMKSFVNRSQKRMKQEYIVLRYFAHKLSFRANEKGSQLKENRGQRIENRK